MFVIGTAGHVDHGKSTLVHALTGINPDRLREEQARQMTLDLGFAWFKLPSGREVSIVDVPGHEDFINNMLAGVGSINIALLVIAADEAVMPQTREHLAILNLLHIPQGVVALTKADLISDPDWLELVQEEIRESLRHTIFANSRIIPVSALTGAGLDELKHELDRLLDKADLPRDIGRPRLPIDRSFSITGFGTVVTGTLVDGRLHVGDEVEIVPGTVRSRIRSLQTHKTKEQEAQPGTRVAVNLTGLEPEDLYRGQVLTTPGWLTATTLADARLEVLVSAPSALRHNVELDFHSGAAQTPCHLRLLDSKELAPGSSGWVQLRLTKPVALVRGDRFIIRSSSLNQTLAGGVIVQVNPARRYRRFQQDVIDPLNKLLNGTSEDLLLQALLKARILDIRGLVAASGVEPAEAEAVALQLIEHGQVLVLGDLAGGPLLQANSGLVTIGVWNNLRDSILETLQDYEQRAPLAMGMPREELKSRLKLPPAFANQILERAVTEGIVTADNMLIRRQGWSPALSDVQQRTMTSVISTFAQAGFTPPPTSEIEKLVSDELLTYMLQSGKLVRVGDNVLFSAEIYQAMEKRVIDYLQTHDHITAAEVRDLLGTSRKYALALLENLDSRRITKRLGDMRVLRAKDSSTTDPGE